MNRMVARALSRVADRMWTRASLARATVVGSGARVIGRASVVNEGTLVIGASAVIVASPAPVQIVVEPGASLTIGDAAVLESGARVRVSHEVHIGAGARIGAGCLIDDGDGPSESTPGAVIAIGEGAWIEDGATLLAGARIAAGANVAAGAILRGASDDAAILTHASPASSAAIPEVRAIVARIVRAASRASVEEDVRALAGWDSLAALRVLVALEEAFGVVLPTDLFAHPRGLAAIAALVHAPSQPSHEGAAR